ncbi:MAG: NAD(P)/FAD-dependent oxidoreductase [Desulfurococcales archaeon]|nr:NAD(P)/FAD-dependent oxidoreductase [Desulfurococcales archaeon]
MEQYKIAVVGAGFAGLFSSYKLSDMHDVDLYEEHGRVGFPKHCTGLISGETYQRIGEPAFKSLRKTYNTIIMEVAGGEEFVFHRSNIAVIVDRVRLEEILLKESIVKGVSYYPRCRVHAVGEDGRLVSNCGTRYYDAIIVADGLNGSVSGSLGVRKNYRRIYGLNLEVGYSHGMNSDSFKIVFNKKYYPGFFAWIIPLDDGKAVVGAGSSKPLTPDAILKGLNIKGQVRDTYGGIILAGPPEPAPHRGRLFVLGDAAGLTKPFTGGGLYPNSKIIECMAGKKPSEWSGCMESVVRELERSVPIARIFHDDLDEEDLALVFRYIKKTSLGERLSRFMDYDDHSVLIDEVLSHRKDSLYILLMFSLKRPLKTLRIMYRVSGLLFQHLPRLHIP